MSPRAAQWVVLIAFGVTYAILVGVAFLALSYANVTHPGIFAIASLWPWILCTFPYVVQYLVPLFAISYAYETGDIGYWPAMILAAGVVGVGMTVAWHSR